MSNLIGLPPNLEKIITNMSDDSIRHFIKLLELELQERTKK